MQEKHLLNTYRIPKLKSRHVFINLARSLVDQNYELAILLASRQIAISEDEDNKADLKRILAVACSNAGLNCEATELLHDALSCARKPEIRARIHYLLGLLYNKRYYDLDVAEKEYQLGIREARAHK